MSLTSQRRIPQKVCFVTVGATANFGSLIETALSPAFLQALKTHDYTHLRLQYGKNGQEILDEVRTRNAATSDRGQDLSISGFDFNTDGLGPEMRAVKREVEGVVISHAGSGSILEALRIAVPIIVVPNPELLDNHQVELADALASQGYVIHGHLNDLPAAIRLTESLRKAQRPWPPVNTEEDISGKGLVGVMDDELGFVD